MLLCCVCLLCGRGVKALTRMHDGMRWNRQHHVSYLPSQQISVSFIVIAAP